ncbi:hypothetical protein HO173_004729 [Letharia columbiana]|uniref:Tautomerase cis-CaaD-like domain-containing protein n=1 Tax=Letharia columbiana TaxID=112416 RepID=A0A8H6FYQ8_9LECA|nr:uncharacterized protein HO173_004729 [Letharia columbiana]KAF6237260.1 hypothetical protein HO173_004729 [Letharia columbiana]
MPLYEIEHITPLSSSQKDALARSITQIHSHLFTTPSLFVNVRFTDTASHDVYVGGKKKSANRILAHVRPGGGRSVDDFNTLCARITESWDLIILGRDAKGDRGRDRELRAVFILGTIVAGSEAGFALPAAGEDRKWLRENVGNFEQRAEAGDGEFGDLVEEMRRREDLKELL